MKCGRIAINLISNCRLKLFRYAFEVNRVIPYGSPVPFSVEIRFAQCQYIKLRLRSRNGRAPCIAQSRERFFEELIDSIVINQ
ncbi:hypothetical protein D4768_21375 [Rhodococcus erythropolis]|nr:hypothetical protein D4768_21375 [Rhodococcus erythropolis]